MKTTIYLLIFLISTSIYGQDTVRETQSHKGLSNGYPFTDSVISTKVSAHNEPKSSVPWAEIISIISILTTGFIAIYTQIVSKQNANEQTKTQRKIAVGQLIGANVSGNRQKWNDQLREKASEFLLIASNLHHGRFDKEEEKEAIVKLLKLDFDIQLLITGDDEKETELRNKLHELYQHANTKSESINFIQYIGTMTEDLKNLFREVLHTQWKKIGEELIENLKE